MRSLPNLLVIPYLLGPTCSGKTNLTSLLSNREVPIINADRGLMFREMDIGTAKPFQTSNHFLINVVSPNEKFTVFKFRKAVTSIISELLGSNHLPIISGGSLFYFEMLNRSLIGLGLKCQTAKRIVRGAPILTSLSSQLVEMFLQLGLSVFRRESHSCPFNLMPLVLRQPSAFELEKRIISRFDGMLAAGLVEEVSSLKAKYLLDTGSAAMKLVGYRHCFSYVNGLTSFSEMRGTAILSCLSLIRKQESWIKSFRRLQPLVLGKDVSCCLTKALGVGIGSSPKRFELL